MHEWLGRTVPSIETSFAERKDWNILEAIVEKGRIRRESHLLWDSKCPTLFILTMCVTVFFCVVVVITVSTILPP